MKPVDVLGLNLEAGGGTPVVLLREQDEPHRVLPIFIGGYEAVAIAQGLGDQSPPRPFTHNLLAALIESLDAHVDHVEVTEEREGTFVARLALRGPHRRRRPRQPGRRAGGGPDAARLQAVGADCSLLRRSRISLAMGEKPGTWHAQEHVDLRLIREICLMMLQVGGGGAYVFGLAGVHCDAGVRSRSG